MQTGYGVPELQQFMVDGCSTAASLLPISYDMTAAAAAQPMQLQQQQHGHFFRPPAQSPPAPHFFLHHQFHGFPFSAGHNHNQQQQQRRMHPELGLGDNQDAGGFESSAGGSPPPKIICGQLGVGPPHFVTTNFSLAVSEAAAAGEVAGLNGDDAAVGDGSDSRALPRWHQQQAREEVEVEEEEVEAAIKEPFWYKTTRI